MDAAEDGGADRTFNQCKPDAARQAFLGTQPLVHYLGNPPVACRHLGGVQVPLTGAAALRVRRRRYI